MRISGAALISLILLTGTTVQAQGIAPPPGFSPGGAGGSLIDPAPSALPSIGDSNGNYGISAQDPPSTSGSRFFGLGGTGYGPTSSRGAFSYPPSGGPIVDPAPLVSTPLYVPFPNVWFSAEALIWWTKSNPVPVPLVVDGTTLGSGPVVLGDQNLSMPTSGGGRFTLGFGFGADHLWAAEGSYFFLNNGGISQGVTSDGSRFSAPLSFPFFDPTIGAENYSPIALPGSYAGTAVVSADTFLQGFDANILRNLMSDGPYRFDVLGGFRWVNLQENLSFNTNSPNVPYQPGEFFNTFDAFNTQNNFYGPQLGGRVAYDNGLLFCNATGKFAMGATVESVNINGGTFTNYTGTYVAAPGGYLAQPSNMGTVSTSRFAVIPELNMNVGVYLTPWARLTLGYSFLFISSVARPSNQIDRVINPNQSYAISGPSYTPGPVSPARPGASVEASTFWAQGLNIGLELRY